MSQESLRTRTLALYCLMLLCGLIANAEARPPAFTEQGQHHGDDCASLTETAAAVKATTMAESSRSAAGPGGRDTLLKLSSAAPAGPGRKYRQEQMSSAASEHRAVEVRTLYLNVPELSPGAEAFSIRPDGSRVQGTITRQKGVAAVKIDHRPMDGTQDGIYTVYVIDRKVVDEVLQVRTAKMYLINHTCSWGHKYWQEYRHKERQRPKSSLEAPLEIVAENLWEGNVHNSARSGDTIPFTLLSRGEPVPAATLRIVSGTGWSRSVTTGQDGIARVQLIRDYYPESWSDFRRSKRMAFMVSAEREVEEAGEYQGKSYRKVMYSTTFPWRYQLQRDEYSSYTYGLGIVALCSVGSSMGVLFYRERRRRPYREVVFDEKG